MTPAERAVIEAAEAWVAQDPAQFAPWEVPGARRLKAAIDALRAERAKGET